MGAALFAAIPPPWRPDPGGICRQLQPSSHLCLRPRGARLYAPARRLLAPDGPKQLPIFLFGSGPLDMDIQSQQGAVTGLAFSMENREQGGVRSLSTTQVWHTVNALLGHGELLAHLPETGAVRPEGTPSRLSELDCGRLAAHPGARIEGV